MVCSFSGLFSNSCCVIHKFAAATPPIIYSNINTINNMTPLYHHLYIQLVVPFPLLYPHLHTLLPCTLFLLLLLYCTRIRPQLRSFSDIQVPASSGLCLYLQPTRSVLLSCKSRPSGVPPPLSTITNHVRINIGSPLSSIPLRKYICLWFFFCTVLFYTSVLNIFKAK